MKIIEFLHGNELGGMEKFCLDLSNALSKEHEVLFVGDKVFKKYFDDSVTFKALDITKSRNNPLFLWRLFNIFKDFSPDIIHVHKQKSIQIMKRLEIFLNIPYVATKHDTQIKKSFYGLTYAIAISEEAKKTIESKYLFKIYNGISYEIPEKIVLPRVFNIVAVGGLRKVKGYDKLIEAVSKLEFPYHLTILGEGSERVYLEALIDKLKINDKVSLLGFRSNIKDYLYSADLQVISSFSEGFSLAMIEGIFYTKVLMSTKVSGCIEILPTNFLVNEEDFTQKIKDIKEHYELYQKEFRKIKERYTTMLTMQNCLEEHEKTFKEIIALDKVSKE